MPDWKGVEERVEEGENMAEQERIGPDRGDDYRQVGTKKGEEFT
jgi:hypothetical protein